MLDAKPHDLDARIPDGPYRTNGRTTARACASSAWPTGANTPSSWSARASPARRLRRRLAAWATGCCAFAIRTARAAPIPSRRRAASTPPRTTRTTATACGGCFTTPSRAAISARARPMSTVSPKSPTRSSTIAWRPACRSPENMAACSTTAPSAARRSAAPSMRRARLASSSCSARIPSSTSRSRPGRSRCTRRTEMLDVVIAQDGSGAGHARHRHPQPRHGPDRGVGGRRGGAGDRRLLQRLLPLDQRHRLQRHRHVARAQARRGLRQSVLHADPSDLHPGARRGPVEAHPDERVAAQ